MSSNAHLKKLYLAKTPTVVSIIAGILLLCHPDLSVAEAPQPAIAPGGLVSWPGQNIETCEIAGRSWSPMGNDACIFPIDLKIKEKSVTVKRIVAGKAETRAVTVADYPYAVQHIELQDESKVNLSEADLARVGRENRRIGALWPLETNQQLELPLAAPLNPLPEGGRFGAKRIINGYHKNPHSGADFSAAQGTPVYAGADGEVKLSEEHFFAGNSIFIDHGQGLISMYFHLHEMLVKPGDKVKRGQQIATVGATGRATGPHLHFGVRWHGKRIDPLLLLKSPDALPKLAP